jgi:hypothetical protein
MPSRRYYTVAEANLHLPELRDLFSAIMQLRAQVKLVYQRLAAAGYPPTDEDIERDAPPHPSGGDPVPPEVLRDQAWFRGLLETLREQIEAIQATGCLIKDLETGLVDWLTLHQGREVYLCWKYGEPEVAYWHELTTGFPGRRPVSELEPAGD